MRTQVKPHGDESTDFHDREVLKVGSNHTYLAVNMVDSVPKKEEYCYWWVLITLIIVIGECKYI